MIREHSRCLVAANMLNDSEDAGLRPASVVFPLSCRKYYKFAVAEGRANAANHPHSADFDLKRTSFTKDALRALEEHCKEREINISVFSVPDEDVCGRLMQVAILASNTAIIGGEDSDTYADIKEYCDGFYRDNELDATTPLNRLWVQDTDQVMPPEAREGAMEDVSLYVADETVPPFKKVRALIMMFRQYIDRGGDVEESSKVNQTTRKTILELVRDNGCYYMDWDVYTEDTTLFALDLLADCPEEAVDYATKLLYSTFTDLGRGVLEAFREGGKFDARDERYIKHATAMGIGALGHAETANLLRRLVGNHSDDDSEQIGTALRTDFVGIAQYFERFTLLHRDRVEQRLKNPLCVYDDINEAVIRALKTDNFDGLNCKEAAINRFLNVHDIYRMREEAYAYIRGVEDAAQEVEGRTITTGELEELKSKAPNNVDFTTLHAELMNWPHFVERASDEVTANLHLRHLREEGATRVVEIILRLFDTVRSTEPAHSYGDGTRNGQDTCGYKRIEIVKILKDNTGTSLHGLTVDQIKKFAAGIVGNNANEASFRIFPSGDEMPVLMFIDQNDVVEAAWALYPQFMKAGRTTGDISKPNTATEALAKALVRKKMKTLFADNATKHMRCDLETATFFGTALLCSLLTSARLTAKSKRGRYNAKDLDSIASAVSEIKQTLVNSWHTEMKEIKLAFEGVKSPVPGVRHADRHLGEGLGAPTAEQLYPAAQRGPTKVLRTDLDREVHYVRDVAVGDFAALWKRDVNIKGIKGINDVDAVWGTSAMPKRRLIDRVPVYEHKQFQDSREKDAHKGFDEFRRAHTDYDDVEDLWGPLTANPVWTGYGSFEIMAQIMPNLGQKDADFSLASHAGGEIWTLLERGELTNDQFLLFNELKEDPVKVAWSFDAGTQNYYIGIQVESMGYVLGDGWKERESLGVGGGWLFDESIYGESLHWLDEMKSGEFVVVTLTGEFIFVEVEVVVVGDGSD